MTSYCINHLPSYSNIVEYTSFTINIYYLYIIIILEIYNSVWYNILLYVLTVIMCNIEIVIIKCTSSHITINYRYMFIIRRVHNFVMLDRISRIKMVNIKPECVLLIRPNPKLINYLHHNVL